MTRRDLQNVAKKDGRPWDSAKGFDRSAPIGHIHRATNSVNQKMIDKTGAITIWLKVNNEKRQDSTIQHMIWNIPEIISQLSNEFELSPGDLIFTGTPAGVGPIVKGDVVTGGIDGCGQISFVIV